MKDHCVVRPGLRPERPPYGLRDRYAERLIDPSVNEVNGPSANEMSGLTVNEMNGPTVKRSNLATGR